MSEICETCSTRFDQKKSPAAATRFCSYWCHLVENGPAFFTLEAINPWLNSNRNRWQRTRTAWGEAFRGLGS